MKTNWITAGVDSSKSSINALVWADRFATAIDGDLRAIAAWQMPLVTYLPEAAGTPPSRKFMIDHTESSLGKAIAEAGLDHRCEPVVHEGRPGAVLVAESAPDGLIVLGRHGAGQQHGLDAVNRLADVVLGSAAHHTINHANGPVVLVPSDASWVDQPRTIVGIDGSPASLDALAWAVDSLPPGSPITAYRAVIPWTGGGLTSMDTSFTPQIIASAEDELRAWVATTISRCERTDTKVETIVDIAAARWALSNPNRDTDLIVVGHRGHSGIVSRLLGSTADYVARHATVPTVIMRDQTA